MEQSAPTQPKSLLDSIRKEERNTKVNNAVTKIAQPKAMCSVNKMDNDVTAFIHHGDVPRGNYENERTRSQKIHDDNENDVIEHKPTGCPVNDMDKETDTYIRKSVLHGSFNCDGCNDYETPNEFSNEQILNYQNDFFGFNDKINYGSSEGLDPTDKLNEMQTSGNNELTDMEGKRMNANSGNRGSNWRYEYDDVNNGGKFYGNIEASDSSFESNLAV